MKLYFNWMEQKKLSKAVNLLFILKSLPKECLDLIVEFLDRETLRQIHLITHRLPLQTLEFFECVSMQNFILEYLNATDRSMYMAFYGDTVFQKIEKQQLKTINNSYSNKYQSIDLGFEDLTYQLKKQLKHIEGKQNIINSLKETISDPQFPLPKMRNSNIGMYCNSYFQFFLVDIFFNKNEDQFMQQYFEQLKIYFELNKIQKLIDLKNNKQLLNKQNNIIFQNDNIIQIEYQQQNLININQINQYLHNIYKQWFNINNYNYSKYIIKQNLYQSSSYQYNKIIQLHNIIVILLALTDNLINTYAEYICTIDDPFHRFVQFNMRYNIFRNFVLSMQEKIGFLFTLYNKYSQNQLVYWRCAFGKWYIIMNSNHQQYHTMYYNLLKKVSVDWMLQNLSGLLQNYNCNAILLRNELQLNYHHNIVSNYEIDTYFKQNQQLYQQILAQYIQYLIDLSIDQCNVHWCGHSQQQLHVPYQQLEKYILFHFQFYSKSIQLLCVDMPQSQKMAEIILMNTIKSYQLYHLKPCTLKKLIEMIQKTPQTVPDFEQNEANQLINFANQDKMLQHFNKQANISWKNTNIQYIVQPYFKELNILKKSSETCCTKNLPLKKIQQLKNNQSSEEEEQNSI